MLKKAIPTKLSTVKVLLAEESLCLDNYENQKLF